jgi:putative SOS response-associated peptidase YedK
MCSRFTNTQRKSDDLLNNLTDQLSVKPPASDRGFERFNIAPTDEVLAVVDDREGRRFEELRWGVVPHWAKGPKARFSMINARADTLAERPAYRGLVERACHRCLVLADGWYEWQRPEDSRQPRRPLHFSLTGGEPFCFAGLWTRSRSPAGEAVASCTIVTCQANELARPIHDRMPVVLPDAEGWEAWLDPALDGEAVSELLVPVASERLAVTRANPIVNSVRHDAPDCLSLAKAA